MKKEVEPMVVHMGILYLLIGLFFIVKQIKFRIETCIVILATIIITLLIHILLFKRRNFSVEKKFLIVALTFGIILIFAIPILHGIDEGAHFFKVYSILNPCETVLVDGRALDKVPKAILEADNISTYKEEYSKILMSINENETKIVDDYIGAKLYSPISYISFLLQMFLCQNVLKLSVFWTIIIGRIFSFLFWVVISYYTIKIMPNRKEFMAFFSLTPMILTLVTTYTGDLITISSILLFLSLWYRLYKEKRKITLKEIFLFILLGVLAVCSKIVYALLFLIILILPKENFKSKKSKVFCTFGILLILIITAVINLCFVGNDLLESYPKIVEQKEFVLQNFGKYVFYFIRSMCLFFYQYLCQLTTGKGLMCHNSVNINDWISLSIWAILFLSLILDKENLHFNIKQKIYILTIIFSITFIIFLSLYLQWTTYQIGVGASLIIGVQGRYFIPIAALLMVVNLPLEIKGDKEVYRKFMWDGIIIINLITILSVIVVF